MANNFNKTGFGISLTLLTTLVLLNCACTIVSYSLIEPARHPLVETSHDKKEVLSFSYIPGSSRNLNTELQTLPREIQEAKDLLERQSRFIKVIVTSTHPAIGTHVNVYQTVAPPYSSPWCTANSWTLGVIPCYAEGIVYVTHFDVFVNNALKQSYQYEISRKVVDWIGLLPFYWINLFTTHYEEAFWANVFRFITDAKRDGFL
jgi:hypothetical protein